MNNKERIINTVLCRSVDRLPFNFYFGPWGETIERWREEGLGENKEWDEDFGFDAGFEIINVNYGYCPPFEYELIEDKGDTRIIRDFMGILQEVRTHGSSIPRYIDYPVTDMESWQKLKNER